MLTEIQAVDGVRSADVNGKWIVERIDHDDYVTLRVEKGLGIKVTTNQLHTFDAFSDLDQMITDLQTELGSNQKVMEMFNPETTEEYYVFTVSKIPLLKIGINKYLFNSFSDLDPLRVMLDSE